MGYQKKELVEGETGGKRGRGRGRGRADRGGGEKEESKLKTEEFFEEFDSHFVVTF